MKRYLFFLAILMFIAKPVFSAPACNKLVEIFTNNHNGAKLNQVKSLMDECLITAQDSDYIDAPVQAGVKKTASVEKTLNADMSCDNKKPRDFLINPNIKMGTVKIREKTSTKDLTTFMNNNSQPFDDTFRKLHTQGLLYANFTLKIEPDTITLTAPKSSNTLEVCQFIRCVNYEVGYDDLLLYISKNTRKQSCEYYFTLRHELIHASINRQVIAEYGPLIANHIKQILLNDNFYYQTIRLSEQPKPDFINKMSSKVNDEILLRVKNKIAEETKKRNNQFDLDEFKNRQERLNYFCSN